MPTQSKENYLKALYHLDSKHPDISVTELGKQLDVKKSSVNNMVKKLVEKGWISHEKYQPIKLTNKGRKAAALIIRKHRLTEMYLVNEMGFGWEEVHDIAEQMEHIKAPKLFDKMDDLLGAPKYDPHGSPIPDKNGNVTHNSYLPLKAYNECDVVILKALDESEKAFLEYLNAKDLRLHTEIEIISIEPFDKSMIVKYGTHENVVFSNTISSRLLCAKK